MIEIQLTNTEQVAKILDEIVKHTQHRTPLMRKLAGSMESAVSTNFNESGRPKWLGLKYRQGKPLIDKENLMESITSHYDNNVALVGTNVVYAAIHHFGGKAGRGKKTSIPARPFMTLTPQDEADLLEGVQDYFRSLIA